MEVKNNSKTSELFNKIQTLYNTGVRGDSIVKKVNQSSLITYLTSSSMQKVAKMYRLDDGYYEDLQLLYPETSIFTLPLSYQNINGNTSIVILPSVKQFLTNNYLPDSLRSNLLSSSVYNVDESQLSKVKFKSAYKPFLKSTTYNSYSTFLPLYSEELFFNPSNINTLNFNLYNNETLFETSDDNYENLKNFQLLYSSNYQNASFKSYKYIMPTTYTTVLDAFRADYDDYN
jgi:hypothetical protein